ncbi:unnamed protein product [Alternaria sp. RS040]
MASIESFTNMSMELPHDADRVDFGSIDDLSLWEWGTSGVNPGCTNGHHSGSVEQMWGLSSSQDMLNGTKFGAGSIAGEPTQEPSPPMSQIGRQNTYQDDEISITHVTGFSEDPISSDTTASDLLFDLSKDVDCRCSSQLSQLIHLVSLRLAKPTTLDVVFAVEQQLNRTKDTISTCAQCSFNSPYVSMMFCTSISWVIEHLQTYIRESISVSALNSQVTYLKIGGLTLIVLVVIWVAQSYTQTWKRLRHIPSAHITAPFSYYWLGRTTYSGRQYWVLRNLHAKHGPLVRIGPNEVLTDDPNVLRTVSSTRSNYARSDWYHAGRFNPYRDNLFTILDPRAHKKAKARSMAAYNGRDTGDLEGIIDEQVKKFIEVIRNRYVIASPGNGQPLLDLVAITSYFTMDVITRMGFGKAVGYLEDEKDHYDFLGTVDELWPRMSTVADVPWIRKFLFSPFVLKFVGPKTSDTKGFGALMGFAAEWVGRRFSAPDGGHKDFLASLMAKGFTEEECQSEGLFLLLAGSESTANAMRSILVHTMSSPAVYNRLVTEIQNAVRAENVSYPVALEQARRLPYLQAIIYEGLRMRPPILGLFPKIVPLDESPIFHDKLLPPGTAVCMNMSSMLQSTALFGADADVFRPERFTEADEETRRQMELDVEMVFGYGGWVCAGKNIAMMDIAKVVFEMFRLFDLQLVKPFEPCENIGYGVFLDKGLKVRVSAKM